MGREGQRWATQERIRVLGEVLYTPAKGGRLQGWLLPVASIMIVPGGTWGGWVLLEVPGMLGVMQEAVHCWPSEGGVVQRVGTWLLSLDSTCHSRCSQGGERPSSLHVGMLLTLSLFKRSLRCSL